MSKKNVPFTILKNVESIVKDNLNIIQNKKEENCYYSFYDIDKKTGYYFKIYIDPKKENVSNYNTTTKLIKYYPNSLDDLKPTAVFVKTEEITRHLEQWISIIKSYNSYESILDDPFVEKYKSYFLNEFKIMDEDKDYAPFDPLQQEDIDDFITEINSKLLEYKTEINEDIIHEVVEEYIQLQNELSSSTKTKVWNSFMQGVAKIYKMGRKEGKALVIKIKDELIKKLIQKGIEYGPDLLEYLSKNLHP